MNHPTSITLLLCETRTEFGWTLLGKLFRRTNAGVCFLRRRAISTSSGRFALTSGQLRSNSAKLGRTRVVFGWHAADMGRNWWNFGRSGLDNFVRLNPANLARIDQPWAGVGRCWVRTRPNSARDRPTLARWRQHLGRLDQLLPDFARFGELGQIRPTLS